MLVNWEETRAEFGFSPLAIRALASIQPATEIYGGLSVLTGDLPLSSDLLEIVPGVRSVGDWPDDQLGGGPVSPARRFGGNLHLATREIDGSNRVGISQDRTVVAAWVDGVPESLADLDGYRDIARALDDAGVMSAGLSEGRFAWDESSTLPEPLISEPFELVGSGGSSRSGHPTWITAYWFADDDAAERAVDGVVATWDPLITDDADGVERDDQAIIVTVTIPDDSTMSRFLVDIAAHPYAWTS